MYIGGANSCSMHRRYWATSQAPSECKCYGLIGYTGPYVNFKKFPNIIRMFNLLERCNQ